MQVTTYTVNEAGLTEIERILTENHRLGERGFTKDMIGAWAADVERSIGEGNGPEFEIRAMDHVRGAAEVFRLSPEHLDAREVEIDE